MIFRNKNNNEKTKTPTHKGKKYNLEELRYQQDTKTRNVLSYWVIIIITLWLGFTGFLFINYGNIYPVVIICTLLGTTTANVLGLGYVLLNGFFRSKENKDK